MKTYTGCLLTAVIIAAILALVLGAALDIGVRVRDAIFLPVVIIRRECRLVLLEDGSWTSPDYHPSEGWPSPCVWVFEEGNRN